jgi:hypothetical protein
MEIHPIQRLRLCVQEMKEPNLYWLSEAVPLQNLFVLNHGHERHLGSMAFHAYYLEVSSNVRKGVVGSTCATFGAV